MPRMHNYGEGKLTQIMMATVRHVTSSSGLRKFQADGFLFNWVYMTTRNYKRTDTMPIRYTVIMIRSAGAKFPPEYSDSNLIVKTQCVKQMWLSSNCRASQVVSVTRKTRLSQLIQPLLQQPLQHSTVLAVCLYVLLLVYLSLPLSLILIYYYYYYYYLTFLLDT